METSLEVQRKKLRTDPSWGVESTQEQQKTLSNRCEINSSEQKLIDMIKRFGELSKSDMVNHTEFSRSKVTSCINSLLFKNIIVANNVTEYTGGRRLTKFGLNGSFGLIAGIDIGVTNVNLGITDFSGKLLARFTEPISVKDGPIRVLGKVCSQLEKMFQENHLNPDHLKGIGVGVPGPVDFSAGTLVSPPIMPGWDRYPIIQTIQQWFPDTHIVVDKDVNLMALGEVIQGAGKGVESIIFVKIGTCIGAGVVCGGKIYRGANGCTGNIGHICVDKNGSLCYCGNRGCLETVAAGPAIAERSLREAQAGRSPILMNYFEKNGNVLRTEDVGNASREGDTVGIEVIREVGQYIGDVLAGLVNFYNPRMIIVGGGVSNLGDLLLSSIRQTVFRSSLPLATRDLQIVFSENGLDAGVIGAINLAIYRILNISDSQAVPIGA